FGYDAITPYIHILASHIAEFYQKYDDLNKYSLQGVEKMNDVLTIDYFRSTNKKGKYLKQIIRKRLIQILLTVKKFDFRSILYQLENAELQVKSNDDSIASDDEDEVITYFKKNWYRMEEEYEFEDL
ncbi:unnamed protein product, partial [Didymodactylos carnosus]